MLMAGVIGLAPFWREALEPPTRRLYGQEHATFGNSLGTWTTCSVNASNNESDTYSTYKNPLWPHGLDWMRLPPNTHLVLYGRSSIGEISSAMRAAATAHGILAKSVVISSARDCANPADDPRGPQETTCLLECDHFATLGPELTKVNSTVDPHSVTVDYLTGNRTITTFANHAQSQRLDARLDDWLTTIAGSTTDVPAAPQVSQMSWPKRSRGARQRIQTGRGHNLGRGTRQSRYASRGPTGIALGDIPTTRPLSEGCTTTRRSCSCLPGK